MKSLLARISFRKFVGLYLGEHGVSVSEMAITPLGPVEIASRTEPCEPNEVLDVAERSLQFLQQTKRRRLQVAVGLPNPRVFFGSRPLRGGTDSSPEGVLQKLLCSSNVTVDDLTMDMVKGSVNKSPAASVAACRKKYMAAVLAALQRAGAQAFRAEPAACALARAAAQQHRPPRRARTLLRIFLGTDEGQAVLTVSDVPMAWRSFTLPAGSEGMAVLCAARTLLGQCQHHGLDLALDYAIVHGRADLHERLQNEQLPSEIGSRTLWREGPDLSGETIARGLAVGCVGQGAKTFDLSRWMKPRPSLREIFPWGELACECVLVVLMGLVLAQQSNRVATACASAQSQCNENKLLGSANAGRLEKEKKELTKKIDALHEFLDSRVLWTSYARDVANCLPAKIQLSQFQGLGLLEAGKKGGAAGKRSLQLTAMAPLTASGAVPPEVDSFLAALRGNRLWKREFPRVELTAVQQAQARGNTGGMAGFTIVCQAGGPGAK
jgi:hypothetical protein